MLSRIDFTKVSGAPGKPPQRAPAATGTMPAGAPPQSPRRQTGAQFSGVTQGAYYGDDVQGATNFPIVRITNVASGGVVYARTSDFSTMSVASKALASAKLTVPTGIAAGASTLAVIANGIASKSVDLTVK